MNKRKFIKIFTAIFIVLIFCVSAQAQFQKRLTPLGNLAAGIQERADNLVYISEEDWDVNIFVIGRNISVLDAETFRSANPKILFEPVEDFDVNTFFARLEKRDEAWTELRDYLEANLTSLKVFKVGNIRRDIYAVGLFHGHIVGIKTFAVET